MRPAEKYFSAGRTVFESYFGPVMKLFKTLLLLAGLLLQVRCTLAQETSDKEADSTGTFTYVEVMPEFPGNVVAYIGENVHYPKVAQQAGIEGRVVVRFVVARNGAVKNAYVETKIHSALDAEALRVVRGIPGKQAGRPVAVYQYVPITFALH